MRVFLTAAVYLISLLVVVVAAFFVVMLLAGPHSGIFPEFIEGVILALGWAAVFTVPVYAAYRTWRWLAGRTPASSG